MFLPRTIFNITLILVFLGMVFWLFSDIVIYVLIASVIASILRPITDYIDDLEIFGMKVPRILAVILSFVILAAVPIVFILLFVPLIIEQIQVLQSLNYEDIFDRVREPMNRLDDFIIRNFQLDKEQGFLQEELTSNVIGFVQSIRVASILNYLLSFTGKIFIYLLAVSFITFFLLYEKGLFRRNILAIVPNRYFEVFVTTFYKIEKLLSNYLIGLLLQVSIMFSIIALGLKIVGIKYALTIAAFAAIINLIPYLGPVLGFLFAIMVVFSTKHADTELGHYAFLALKTLPVFAIAQLIDNILLQPLIFSKSVKAHPLEIFIIIFVGAALAGGWGMIAAIPMYTILRVSFIELSKSYRQYHVFRAEHNKPLR